MTCPKCSTDTEETTDQNVAGGASVVSGILLAKTGLFAMMAMPYLLPVAVGGWAWSLCSKVTCPRCGLRFNRLQAGSK